MGYVSCTLQNAPPTGDPDIVIRETDPEWDEAIKRWREGKNPTDSKLWKKGVYNLSREVTENSS
jgi:hypothetical protein